MPLEVKEVIVRLIDREDWIFLFDLSQYHLLRDDWDWYQGDKKLPPSGVSRCDHDEMIALGWKHEWQKGTSPGVLP